jgi:cell wall integrity and stress response component
MLILIPGGGNNMWSVYLTGVTRNKIGNLDPSSVTSSDGAKTSTTQLPQNTVIVTAKPSTTTSAAPKKGSSKPNTVGIAVGVVVGLIAIAGLVLGVFLFLRHKRRRDAEEEYKRQAAVNQFVNGNKSHNSSGSMNDTRLEPDILQRRDSTGTIADNQDYSRRILKVCHVHQTDDAVVS